MKVDNFNVTESQDQFLDVMLKYRCRILFTTRSRYENHISLEVGELNMDTLLEPVGKFLPEAEKKQAEIKSKTQEHKALSLMCGSIWRRIRR